MDDPKVKQPSRLLDFAKIIATGGFGSLAMFKDDIFYAFIAFCVIIGFGAIVMFIYKWCQFKRKTQV